jgi:hypothetical protein
MAQDRSAPPLPREIATKQTLILFEFGGFVIKYLIFEDDAVNITHL